MTADKAKQIIAFVGGFLGALYAFFNSIDVQYAFFNPESIDGFLGVLGAFVPFLLIGFGIYKNQFLLSPEAKKQEETLKRAGLK